MSTLNKKKFKSQSRSRKVSLSVTYVLLIVLGVIWLIPLLWIVLSAFRCEYLDGQLVGKVVSNFFPKAYGLENFKNLFSNPDWPFLRWGLTVSAITRASSVDTSAPARESERVCSY